MSDSANTIKHSSGLITTLDGDHLPFLMCLDACRNDNPDILAYTFSLAHKRRAIAQQIKQRALESAIYYEALKCLNYLLVDVAVSVQGKSFYEIGIHRDTPIPVLEILLHHGWDINACSPAHHGSRPFLWDAVYSEELMVWCLAHGATLTRPQSCKTSLLQEAAIEGSVATFEMLRSRRAGMGQRTLHLAVQKVTHFGNSEPRPIRNGDEDRERDKDDQQVDETIEQHEARMHLKYPTANKTARMAMVQHLVEQLGLDVNSQDQPPVEQNEDLYNGTPLCYVCGPRSGGANTKELTWYLMDHGADPDLRGTGSGMNALQLAEDGNRKGFIVAVQEWRARQNVNNSV